jgi:predicted double-glycine peptidase
VRRVAKPRQPIIGHGCGGAMPPRPSCPVKDSRKPGKPGAARFVTNAVVPVAIAFLAVSLLAVSATAIASPAQVRSLLERRQHNVVLQQYDLSCGAAALATILRYQHGERLTERDVAIGLVSRDVYLENPAVLRQRSGFSFLDMNRYTDQLGLDGQAFGSVGYEDLLALAPAIVPLRLHGYNHFVVFRGAVDGNVVLADPAYGNRTMTEERFVRSWIEYADLGHVAFVVRRRDGLIPPNRLEPTGAELSLIH